MVTPLPTVLKASTSSPESVSSRTAIDGSSKDICNISKRFFSPPENPTFTNLLSISSEISNSVAFSLMIFTNSIPSNSGKPLATLEELIIVRRKVIPVTPGSSIGY